MEANDVISHTDIELQVMQTELKDKEVLQYSSGEEMSINNVKIGKQNINEEKIVNGNDGGLISHSEKESSHTEDEDEEVVNGKTSPIVSFKSVDKMSVDDYGFYSKDFKYKKDIPKLKSYRKIEAKWINIITEWQTFYPENQKKIKKMCREGLPESLRAKIWQLLAGSVGMSGSIEKYNALLAKPDLPIYEIIERDINRCYPDHQFFRGQNGQGQIDLFNILKAYAQYNPEVGYCQGMGRLVGLMLMEMPVVESFWLLVTTLDNSMKGYYLPDLERLRIDAMVFEWLIFKYIPKLAKHLQKNDVVPLVYMTQWFLTLFTMVLPWPSVLRVWDMFYCEGIKVLFRVSLAILVCVKDHILKDCPTTIEIMQFILHIPFEFLEAEKLVKTALKLNLSSKDIFKLRERAEILWNEKKPAKGTLSLRATV